jgi:hypothetical protein
VSRIDRFLFAPVDPRTAEGFRLAFTAVVVVMFWPEGRAVSASIRGVPGAAELWAAVFLTPAWWIACIGAIAAWSAGIGGRATAAGVLLLLLPLAFLNGVGPSRQILLTSFLAFSLVRSHPREAIAGAAPGRSAGPIWPIRLIQLQLSITYLVNAWSKTTPEYLSGSVLMALSSQPNFLVDLSDGRLHAAGLAVPVWVCALATVATEYALGLLWWIPRLRPAAALLGAGFHLSLQLVIEIGWLDWTCLFLYLAFLLPFDATARGRVSSSSPSMPRSR